MTIMLSDRASLVVSMMVLESWKAKQMSCSVRDNRSELHRREAASSGRWSLTGFVTTFVTWIGREREKEVGVICFLSHWSTGQQDATGFIQVTIQHRDRGTTILLIVWSQNTRESREARSEHGNKGFFRVLGNRMKQLQQGITHECSRK